jgi:arylsulfatase A-like enzyme
MSSARIRLPVTGAVGDIHPLQNALVAAGAVFVSAYTPSPICIPCRSALIAGNSPSTNCVFRNPVRLQPGAKSFHWWCTGSAQASKLLTSAGD